MSALALSVLLSFVSAVAYAGGAIVQEQVAVSSPSRQFAPLRRPVWWAAVALNGLGALLHVVALAYGPLSVVQPLGALTIVFALPMAALFVGRKAGATAWRGAIMTTVGLAGLLSVVGVADTRSLDTTQRALMAVVTASAVVALMIAGRAAHRHSAVRSILLAIASGTAFGMSSVFTKSVTVDWTGDVSGADVRSLAVIGVLAAAGMLLSQASYRGAGLAAPLATLTVVNPVVAAAVGITMFGETFRHGTAGTALALSCSVVAAGGLILLTTERMGRTPAASGTDGESGGESGTAAEETEEPSARVILEPTAPRPSLAQPRPAKPAEGLTVRVVRVVWMPERPVAPGVREGALVPAPAPSPVRASGPPVWGAAPSALKDTPDGDSEPSGPSRPADGPASFYGPFYGGQFIPRPPRDRHRTHVRS